MNIAVIIPDRGDRLEFSNHCVELLAAQTANEKHHIGVMFINHPPKSDAKDITERYRIGYEGTRSVGWDCILFMENDDWYSPTYIDRMIAEWCLNGFPDLMGCPFTYYYQLSLRKYMKLEHPSRASMMNTLIKPNLHFSWCDDAYPYTDMHLWKSKEIVNKKVFLPSQPICVGMKHGVGLCGGILHTNKFERYTHDDSNFEFLKSLGASQKSIDFYSKFKV